MNEKGELSASFVVGIVLAIIGFVLILLIFGQLNLGGLTEDEVCEASILARASVPDSVGGAVPLECSTKKICLTSDRNSKCDINFGGQSPSVVKLPRDEDEEAARMIEKIIADAMFDCWRITGEGKLDLFGSYAKSRGLAVSEPTCLICSRVAVDKSVNEDVLKGVDIYSYMKKEKSPSGKGTYLQEMSGDKDAALSASVNAEAFKSKLDELENNETRVTIGEREIAVLFSQIKITSWSDSLKKLAGDALPLAAGAFFTPVVGIASKSLVLTPAGIGVLAVASVGTAAFSYANVYEGRTFAAGYCGDFVSNVKGEKEGCSLIQIVPYSVDNINALCTSIQGNL